MPHDIQIFSDALAISPQLDVVVEIKIHGHIVGVVEFNGQPCNIGITNLQIGLHDDVSLVSRITNYVEGSSAVEITNLTINGYNVIPTYQHYSSSGNAYHDWIGIWQMEIPGPFYPWYHTASGQGWVA